MYISVKFHLICYIFKHQYVRQREEPLFPMIISKRLLKTLSCSIKKKNRRIWLQSSMQFCEYYDLKKQNLRMGKAILRSQMDRQELASSMCDLFGLEIKDVLLCSCVCIGVFIDTCFRWYNEYILQENCACLTKDCSSNVVTYSTTILGTYK